MNEKQKTRVADMVAHELSIASMKVALKLPLDTDRATFFKVARYEVARVFAKRFSDADDGSKDYWKTLDRAIGASLAGDALAIDRLKKILRLPLDTSNDGLIKAIQIVLEMKNEKRI